jgi:phosphoglycolate phosphatase
MRFDAVVFDFDGTLVDSASAKYQAFFDIFPGDDAIQRIVADVLRRDPDGSRHAVIPRMVALMREHGIPLAGIEQDRISAYGEAVLAAVAACPALPRAEEALRLARKSGKAHVSSNTPQEPLRDLLGRRGWLPLIDGIHGYPARKADTLRAVVAQSGAKPDRVLAVGDGPSDEDAAREVGCPFVKVTPEHGLDPAIAALEGAHVPG